MHTDRSMHTEQEDLVTCSSCRGETLSALCTFVAQIGWLCRPCFGKYYRVLGKGLEAHHRFLAED